MSVYVLSIVKSAAALILATITAVVLVGGAAVLAGIQGQDKPSDLDGWQEAVAEYGGIDLYATEVYETLQSGASATTVTDLEETRAMMNRDRGAKQIDLIVIHIAEGSYSGTISWFKDRHSNVSAHYVVGPKGNVAQCVRNEDIAWHAGNWEYNRRSIGIEHSGYASSPGAFQGKYRTSAKLSAYLARRFNIPVKKRNFVLHRNVPGVNKTCPGPHFNYDKYLRLVRRFK